MRILKHLRHWHEHHAHGHHGHHHHCDIRRGHEFSDEFGDEPGRGSGRGFGHGGGRHGRGERAERVFGRGDLPLIVLALIETAPRHGYEIIKAIEERCNGAYTPSAGAIYPTLTLLEEQEFISSMLDATGKKSYQITEGGNVYLQQNRAQVDGVLARLELFARVQARQSLPERIHQAMHTLKHALLLRKGSWSEAEADRVAKILERAAHDIVDPN
jgi:DNA-binding PadR family transcriptional regulator